MVEHTPGTRTKYGWHCSCGRVFATIEKRGRHLKKVKSVDGPAETCGFTDVPGWRCCLPVGHKPQRSTRHGHFVVPLKQDLEPEPLEDEPTLVLPTEDVDPSFVPHRTQDFGVWLFDHTGWSRVEGSPVELRESGDTC